MTTSWARGTATDTTTFRSIESAIGTFTTGTETAPGAGARDGVYAAATEYSAGDFVTYEGVPYVSLLGTNTGNTPSSSPTYWAKAGIYLMNIDGFDAIAETASAMTAGGKFICMTVNKETGSFCPYSGGDLDLTAAAVTKQAWPGFSDQAGPRWILYYPSGIGGANPVKLYLQGARSK